MDGTRQSAFPRLKEAAPAFSARTAHGERTLEDCCGMWLILFSHPADFTPVCTAEFIAFARAAPKFAGLGCERPSLSIDSLFSPLARVRNIKETFGVDVPIPIIEDLKMDVARACGRVHPGAADTQAVRATVFIDPNGVLRATAHDPMSNGRGIDDFVRRLTALQTSDANGVATPEYGCPDQAVIMPPSKPLKRMRRKAATRWRGASRPVRRRQRPGVRPAAGTDDQREEINNHE